MQLGFVIDHSRCIGCHACTVACKSENDVPLGSFRTWVKYTEQGEFPEVKRSFAVLRCNQCSDAPCVAICPVKALQKRPDGIVDVDPNACIGCKACMQGCPYDALYLNPSKGIAEKCHFCAHRVEVGLAPACAVVCPTEAIVPGDFHDPQSTVSRLRAEHDLQARKTEAGTEPNVLYREVAEAGIDPSTTHGAGGYLWANQMPGAQLDAERFLADADERATARTTYDVEHPPLWGWRVSAYMFTKSIAAGIVLVMGLLGVMGLTGGNAEMLAATLGFLGLTTLLLVLDLKRPERFLYILMRPNWGSWLVRGSVVLIGFGATVTTMGMLSLAGNQNFDALLLPPASALAALTAAYTGWLFGQSKGRVLWMRRGLWLHLIVQAIVAGAAVYLTCTPLLDLPEEQTTLLRTVLLAGLIAHGLFVLTEGAAAPRGRSKEYRRAMKLVTGGPFAARHYGVGIALGIVVPVVLLALSDATAASAVAALLALLGLYIEEDILVRAGQALRIS